MKSHLSGEETLIFCAIYLASHVKDHISIEGALSGPTESDNKRVVFSIKHSTVHSASLCPTSEL